MRRFNRPSPKEYGIFGPLKKLRHKQESFFMPKIYLICGITIRLNLDRLTETLVEHKVEPTAG